MAQILVRDLDEKTVESLKALAKKHGRSLQMEVKQILNRTAARIRKDPYKIALGIQKKLSKRKYSDSTELLRSDRER